MSIPLDSDGFVRRACPSCAREFKWHSGPTADAPADRQAAEEYFCPYCGSPAAPDQWFTEEQVEYARQVALAEAMPELRDQLRRALEPLNRSGFVKAEIKGGDAGHPPPLVEDDDMLMVASPCHRYEPVKVDENWSDPVHCLVCGAAYTLPPH
jgi:DNA-directed RNA polymerase subunit RPC12/RpoP